MSLENLKKLAYEKSEFMKKEFEEINDFIFKNPELGFEERISSKYLVEKLKGYGFKVEYPYMGFETAFRAEYGDEEGPTVAFLPEYDALPGYGEKGEPGHACGHNWIAAGTMGAAIVLSTLKEHFKGKIVVIGTPAEETSGTKCNMSDDGAFNDIDTVFQMHLGDVNNTNCMALAMDAIEFRFKGKSSHASAHPHLGVNALDAVNLMFAGVNALRQHVTPDVRIHGIITEGGMAPNIVPDSGVCRFYIRAAERKYLNEITQKVINCAKGAELMTGAELSYHNFENSYDNIVNNVALQEIMEKNLEEAGIRGPFRQAGAPSGSTDIGNVSQVCPTMYVELLMDNCSACVHEKEFLDHVNSSEAYDKLHKSIKAMAGSALEIYSDKNLVEKIKNS